MRIGVALRLVPDLADDIEFSEDGTSLDLEWIDVKLNEFDDHALEEGLILAESHGAEVVAMALENEGADRLLRTALARGANRAVKITVDDEQPMDSRAMAPLFAEAAHSLGIDLLLTGVQSPDDLFGPLVGYLGAALGWPFAGAVAGTKLNNGIIEVHQEYSGGYSSDLSITLPAVLGIQTASKPLRYVSGSKMREMMNAELGVVETDAKPTMNAAHVAELFEPVKTGRAEMLEGTPSEIAANLLTILTERGLYKG